MSSGSIFRSKYQADAGNGGGVYPCKLNGETLIATFATTANAPPTGDVDQPVSARANKSRREYGVGMRKVLIEWDSIPSGYITQTATIVVLRPETFAAWTVGARGTYLGTDATVISRTSEDIS